MNIKKTNKQDEFINYFNELHTFLKKELRPEFLKTSRGRSHDQNYDMTFSECITTIKESNTLISLRVYQNELDLINNLRNTLVHNRTNKFYDIADPSDLSMKILKEVYNYFLRPAKITKYLSDNNYETPLTMSPDTSLSTVLDHIYKNQFSQFPVFLENNFIGMVTDNGITNFIAKQKNDEGIIFGDFNVDNILDKEYQFEEYKNSYSILFENDELYRVIDTFYSDINQAKYILISKSGKREIKTKDDLVAIFTSSDIPNIKQYLNK